MADNHDGFVLGMFLEQSTEVREGSARPKRILKLQLALVAEFIAYERSGLSGTLQRTGNHRIHLNVQRSQGSPDHSALCDSLFVESTLLVLFRVGQRLAGVGVTQKVHDHTALSLPSNGRSSALRTGCSRNRIQSLPAFRQRNQEILGAKSRRSRWRFSLTLCLPGANVAPVLLQKAGF